MNESRRTPPEPGGFYEHGPHGPAATAPPEEVPVARPSYPRRSGWVTALGIVNIVWGALELIQGAALLMAAGVVGATAGLAGHPALGVVSGMVTAVFVVLAVVAFTMAPLLIAAGVGILKRRPWGRTLALVLATFSAIAAVLSLAPMIAGFVLYGLYAVASFAILLPRRFAAEFRGGPLAEEVPMPRRSRGLVVALVLGLPLAFLAGGVAGYLAFSDRSPVSGDGPPMVAVVPDYSNNADQALRQIAQDYAYGITSELAGSSDCRVLAQSLVKSAGVSAQDPRWAGRQLHANVVLVVRVTTQGNTLVTDTELVAVHSGALLSAKQYRSSNLFPTAQEFLQQFQKGQANLQGLPDTCKEIARNVKSKMRDR